MSNGQTRDFGTGTGMNPGLYAKLLAMRGETSQAFIEDFNKEKVKHSDNLTGQLGKTHPSVMQGEMETVSYALKDFYVDRGILSGLESMIELKYHERKKERTLTPEVLKQANKIISTKVGEWRNMLPPDKQGIFDKKINMWLNSTYYESTGVDVAEKELSSLGYLFKDYGRHPDMEISSEGSKVAISNTHFISPKKYEDPWEEQIMNDFINQDNILNLYPSEFDKFMRSLKDNG